MTTVVTNDNCPVFYGLAADLNKLDKSQIGNGTTYIAIDSSARYLFDAEHKVWLLQPCNTSIGG